MGSVLVIEDEKGILGLIEAALTHFGHQVETAQDGKEGIRKYDRGRFDVVITDYIMPEVDGQGVVKHIRGSERGWTPVVGMSGTPWLMPDAGFDLVLIKPFPLNKIVDAVQQLCAGPALPEAASRRRAESPFMQPASL
jgi:CheY-like chemotaxis protein